MSLDVLLTPTRKVVEVLVTVLTHLHPHHWYTFDAVVVFTAVWTLLGRCCASRRQLPAAQPQGPPSESFLYGVGKRILDAEDSGAVCEAWVREFGPAYLIPSTLGSQMVVLCDPNAIAHFYSKEGRKYIHTPFSKKSLADLFGKGLVWAHGESHRRQRKSLTPAFSIPAIRSTFIVVRKDGL